MLNNFRFANTDCIIFFVKCNDYHIFCFQFHLSNKANHSITYANKGLTKSIHLMHHDKKMSFLSPYRDEERGYIIANQ